MSGVAVFATMASLGKRAKSCPISAREGCVGPTRGQGGRSRSAVVGPRGNRPYGEMVVGLPPRLEQPLVARW